MRQEVVQDDMDIVSRLQAALLEQLGEDLYAVWFADRVKWQLVDGQLQIRVANEFTRDRLRNRCRAELETAARLVIGGEVTLLFEVEDAAVDGPGASPKRSRQRRLAFDNTPDRSPRARRPARPRLEGFVVGPSNRVAYTSTMMVLERPGSASPLFVYGPNGSGKSHLLEGIRAAARRTSLLRRVVGLSAEQFTSGFLEALHGSGLPSFRRKHRDVDMLLIDDVQFFAGKRATLVELLHTMDDLLRRGRQVVLAADRSPRELVGLGPELVARFGGGLVCQIDLPDRRTRRAILGQWVADEMPPEVLDYLAEQLVGDARQLRGAVNRLRATRQAWDQPVTVELAASALTDVLRATRRVIQFADIETAVCELCGLDSASLASSGRAKSLTQPRMLAMWLARKHTRAAFSEIGRYFGRRSHSTVISAQKKVDAWLAEGSQLQLPHGSCDVQEAVRRIESQLRAG